MALIADPVFYHTVRRNSGGKRKLIYVTNSDPVDLELEVQEVEKPEWMEIEGIFPTAKVKFERGKRTPVIVNLNTTHQYFPSVSCMNEKAKVTFTDGKHVLEIAVALPEIVDKIEPFRGVFAIDFGTTNSVYAYKGRAMDIKHHGKASTAATVSQEIPSAIFFHNVADKKAPRYSIGTEALFDIKENSSRTYSYVISAKRRMGQNRMLPILDRLGGQAEHRQEYHVEQIAAFIIKELLERAQEEIGQKITQVVATYPPMFSRGQKEAIARAIQMAMQMMGVELGPDSLVMDLDEANAGIFNHIYGPLLDEFRDFQVTERRVDLLSLDFGGGTSDISLVSVRVTRNQQGRIAIETELRGLSGDAAFGGDMVTLEVVKMLKIACALAAAEARAKELAEEKQASEKEAKAADSDLWGDVGVDKSIWEGLEGEEKKEEKPVEDPEVAEIENREPTENYKAALGTLLAEKAIVKAMIGDPRPVAEVVAEMEKAEGTFAGDEQAAARARIIESAIETVIPTQFAKYENVDPLKMEVARNLFHSLWHEADLLKIRMSSAANGKAKVTGVLKKVAKYTGVDPIIFNDIEFSLESLDRRTKDRVERIVRKAKQLYEGAQSEGQDGLLVVGSQTERPPLRVLLLGNCANLPIIQRTVAAAFGAEGQTVVFDRKNLKRAVASGACEEYALRKEFGEKGLITYQPKGFLDRLPYSLGIMHRDLALMGYPNGFCPIFSRGAKIGEATVLDENSAFLIHEKMKDLAIFADYKDGAEPVYVGWIDFSQPTPPEKLPKRLESDAVPEGTMVLQAKISAPEGSFAVKFELLGNRELVATNLKTKTKHMLQIETENWDPNLDPFSGIH